MSRHLRVHFSKDLGFFDAVGLGVGFIVGSGIYIMPVLMAQVAGLWSLFGWIAGGAFSILVGLCFAECAVRIPKVGGLYAYAHQTLGDFWGFLTGYTFWLGYWLTLAVEQLALAWYLGFFWDAPLMYRIGVSVLVLWTFTRLNVRGVKTGGKLEDFFTVGKIIPLLFLVALGAYFFRPERFVPDAMVAFPALFSTVILALWAYQGAEIITVPEEEIKHAKKTVPKAILVSILTVTVLYLLVAGAVLTLPWASFVQSQAPLADLVGSLVGPWGGFVLAIGGLLSILGALNAVILASSRISYAMSQDGLFPKYFSHLHEKHGTPDHALVMHAMAASVVVFVLQDFSQLATLVVFFTLVPYFFSSLSTYILQKKHPHPHSLLGKSALIPALAAVLSFGLALYAGFLSPFLSVGFLTFGIAAYVVFRRDAGSGKQAAFGSSHRFDAKNPGKNNRKKR